MTSSEARRMLSVEGQPINIRTFDKLIEEGIVPIEGDFGGKRTFKLEDIQAVVKYLPKVRPAPKDGIVNYVKEAMKSRRK